MKDLEKVRTDTVACVRACLLKIDLDNYSVRYVFPPLYICYISKIEFLRIFHECTAYMYMYIICIYIYIYLYIYICIFFCI